MRTLYLDCFSGMSGNMFLAAMIELGVEYDYLKKELNKLHLDNEFELKLSKVDKNGIVCHYVDVLMTHEHHHEHSSECDVEHHEHHHEHSCECDEHHHGHNNECDEHHHEHSCECDEHHHEHNGECHGNHHEHSSECDGEHHEHYHEHCCENHQHSHVHRNVFDIHQIIEKSELSLEVQELAKKIFGYVARAESKVHGKPLSEIHFHEVGAIDSIVDIIGAAICIDYLKIKKVLFSPVATGKGFVNCAHGLMPLPAPATLEILRESNTTFYASNIKGELLTPTGAAILAAIGENGVMPEGEIEKIGYGAGKRDYQIPNVVRATIFEHSNFKSTNVAEINFQIDDMTGEELGFFMELGFNQGAKDIYYQPIFMKKNRPATEVVLIIEPARLNDFAELIFKHTSTLGFRYRIVSRMEMSRQQLESNLNGEKYQVKIAEWQNVQKISYEYEDIKRIALAHNKTLQEVLNEISFSVFQSIEEKTNKVGK